jgi:hypothetical protein
MAMPLVTRTALSKFQAVYLMFIGVDGTHRSTSCSVIPEITVLFRLGKLVAVFKFPSNGEGLPLSFSY